MGAVTTADTEGTYWENYIYRLAAESENHFSLSAEKGETDEITEMLVQGDLTVIRSLLNLDWNIVREFYDPERPCVCLLTPPIEEDGRACHLREALKFADSLSESVKKLENYYRIHLCGILGKYRAFLWNGSLQGIKEHDPITSTSSSATTSSSSSSYGIPESLWKAKGPIMSFCTETRERENPPASRLF